MNPKQVPDFIDHFNPLTDPRAERNQLHSMIEIIFLTVCATIACCEGWADIEAYGKAKLAYLRTFLTYKNGIPSDDTMRRFFRAVDPVQFQSLFRQWVQPFYTEPQSQEH